MRIVTAAQMAALDVQAAAQRHLPPEALMEAAGAAVFAALERRLGPAHKSPALAVLCGAGNNGGDGLVVARRWLASGRLATVFLLSRIEKLPPVPALMLARYLAAGGRVIELTDESALDHARPKFAGHGALLDALHGSGLNRPLESFAGRVVDTVQLEFAGKIFALDLPSGLTADGAHPVGSYMAAAVTFAIGALKPCHLLDPARKGCGEVELLDIGLPLDLLPAHPAWELLAPARFAEALKRRPRAAHKGQFGHLLVIGGSRGKSGAPALAGLAALRAGAGLVTVAAPESVIAQISAHAPELMTLALPEKNGEVDSGAFAALKTALERADALVCGMGLGTGEGAAQLLAALAGSVSVPSVLDADALNIFAGRPEALANDWNAPLVITPHAGEAARLLGTGSAEANRQRPEFALKLARLTGACVIYKGHQTLITDAQGNLRINPTGNPGMATAGAGDVLAGIAGALLARKLAAEPAASLAAYWHGLAGDLAAEEMTEEGLIAGDLIRFLPAALKKMRAEC